MDVQIDGPPNPGLARLLLGPGMSAACLLFAMRAAAMYQGRVHKETGELAEATTARVTTLSTRWGPRYAGEVIVDSDHFLPHEEGWYDDEGQFHDGAHDFNAVLAEMSGSA